jgi:hypothetical protein
MPRYPEFAETVCVAPYRSDALADDWRAFEARHPEPPPTGMAPWALPLALLLVALAALMA